MYTLTFVRAVTERFDFAVIIFSNNVSLFEQLQLSERVKVLKGTPESSTLKAGDNFGDEVILDRQKYSDTVISLQTVTGWKISREHLTKTIPVEKLKKSN